MNPNICFAFDTGVMSVVKVLPRTGETWVYVQPGVKKLTVSHQQLGVMRDYYFPVPIEEATSYELQLTTATVTTIVEPAMTRTGYLLVNSTPGGADVTINDEWVGVTPWQKKYNIGERVTYRVSAALHHDEVGVAQISDTKNEVNATLRPAYGSLRITSTPPGAAVYLDSEGTSRGVTPLTIERVASGAHTVRVQKEMYGRRVLDAMVTDGATSEVTAALSATFATLTVNSLTGAAIKADGAVKGSGSATWTQSEGLCDIEVSLDGHRPARRQIEVTASVDQTITLEPTPLYGALAVESTPLGAEIWIDGKKVGTTPDVIERLLDVNHTVTLMKAGCADYSATVTIREGQESQLEATLQTGETMTITTGGAGDAIYIDGKQAGISPLTLTVPYGSHTAYAVRGDKRTAEKSFSLTAGTGARVETLSFAAEPRTFEVKGVKFTMVPVEGGTFTMGRDGEDSNEKPAHSVTLSSYMIGQTEVTQALWRAVMGSNPSHFKGDNLPVETVSWEDCQEFISKLNKLTGEQFRLPTEAEWEYAARGGDRSRGYKYSGGNDIGSVAWYDGNSGSKTHPVGKKAANELGLYDMTGNVWEWCSDWYGSDYYSKSPAANPQGPATGQNRVNRGGGWLNDAANCRVANRNNNNPDNRNNILGLRLCLPAQDQTWMCRKRPTIAVASPTARLRSPI